MWFNENDLKEWFFDMKNLFFIEYRIFLCVLFMLY